MLHSPSIHRSVILWGCIRPRFTKLEGFGSAFTLNLCWWCWFWVAYACGLRFTIYADDVGWCWFWVAYALDLLWWYWFWVAYAQIYRAMEGFGWIFFETRAKTIQYLVILWSLFMCRGLGILVHVLSDLLISKLCCPFFPCSIEHEHAHGCQLASRQKIIFPNQKHICFVGHISAKTYVIFITMAMDIFFLPNTPSWPFGMVIIGFQAQWLATCELWISAVDCLALASTFSSQGHAVSLHDTRWFCRGEIHLVC